MATKFYPISSAPVSDLDTGNNTKRTALLVKGPSAASFTMNTVAGPTSGVQLSFSGNAISFFTKPLNAVTISGTVTFNVWMSESSNSANVGPQYIVERTDGSGNIISTVINSERGTEVSTTNAARNWTGTPTSTTLSNGDRLRITIYGNDVGTMGSGFTFNIIINGATDAASGDSWVQFTETITEYVAPTTQIKKLTGTTQATVKKVSGTTIATAKKVAGVANT